MMIKLSCPICFQQVDLDPQSDPLERCPTCNNDLPSPTEGSAATHALRPATTVMRSRVPTAVVPVAAAPVVAAPVVVAAETRPVPSAIESRVEEAPPVTKPAKRFSFRILALSLLITLLIVVTAAVVALAILFAIPDAQSEIVLGFRDVFFDRLGITDPSQYDTRTIAFTIGQFALPLLLGIIALVAIGKRKRILTLVLLLVITGLGVASAAPAILAIPVLCLILALLPGRSRIWQQA